MVTKRKPSIYDCIAGSHILSRGETLFPLNSFTEYRNWDEIAKELDLIKQKYSMFFPEFDLRIMGWNYIYTLQGKKRVYIE
jgi:hypothetical protein